MPEADLFLLFIRPLNRAGIRYMIGGAIAAISMVSRGLRLMWTSWST